MDSAPALWICPASVENLHLTIEQPFKNKYSWAFNASKRGQWEKLRIGDMCLFGNINKKYNIGYKYLSFVVGKEELTSADDNWPFRSPSGTPWKYAFFLTPPIQVNITKQMFLDIRPSGSPQTQIMARGEEEYKFKQLIERHVIGHIEPRQN
jgi:hypothetical protein